MKVICSWCHKHMGEKEGPKDISHSICEECFNKLFPKINKKGKT